MITYYNGYGGNREIPCAFLTKTGNTVVYVPQQFVDFSVTLPTRELYLPAELARPVIYGTRVFYGPTVTITGQ